MIYSQKVKDKLNYSVEYDDEYDSSELYSEAELSEFDEVLPVSILLSNNS